MINPPLPGAGRDFFGNSDVRSLINVAAPVIRFQTETEMLNFFAAETGRQIGSQIRTYEMAGGVHVDLQLESTGLLIRERDLGSSSEPAACPRPVIPISVSYIQSALLRATEAWVRDGIEPPPSLLIQLAVELGTNGKTREVVVYDENGNATGGVRSPQIEVPLGHYIADPYVVGPLCYLNGGFVPFDDEKFRQLYPTDQFYVLEVDREISRAVADGFVLAEDADSLRQDMLVDAGIAENVDGVDSNNTFGCALGSNGRPDPTFPALVLIALAYLTRRKWLRVH
jgi:hypothetical protein